jgi:cysteine protease ATG4
MGLESISEPDDMDLDDEEGLEEEVEGEGEQFFDTRSGSASTSSASAASNHHGRERRSEEIDTEEDSVDPLTPGPASRFDIINPPSRRKRNENENEGDEEDEEDDRGLDFRPDDVEGFGDDDIEDDWVDPSVPTPSPRGPPAPAPARVKDPSPSPPSSSNVPPLAKSKSSSSTSKHGLGSGSTSGKSKKAKKQIPVPVPAVRLPSQQQEHYPFPVTPVDDPSLSPQDRARSPSTRGKRMHTARARDGGRTQSGGVKGILTDD